MASSLVKSLDRMLMKGELWRVSRGHGQVTSLPSRPEP